MKALIWIVLFGLSQAAIAPAPASAANHDLFPLYVKVQLDKSIKLSLLKPGDVTEGKLGGDVYSADRKLFSDGSLIRLIVDHLKRKPRAARDRWPWVVRVFLPRQEKFPSFKDAAISVSGVDESRLQVSLISASRGTEIHAQPGKGLKAADSVTMAAATVVGSDPRADPAGNRSHLFQGQIMSFEAHEETSEPHTMPDPVALTYPVNPVTLPAGTACRILLLRSLSASKSRPGDVVQARLLEPIVVNSHLVLLAGSLFEGSVIKVTPPRMLSRAGSLSLTFTALTLPNGSRLPLSASLTGVELNRGSHTKMDAEGRLHGDRPGFAWMLINGGVTAGIAKEVDDGTQLVMEAILSGANDASTAGTARIVLNRPLQISAQTPPSTANGAR